MENDLISRNLKRSDTLHINLPKALVEGKSDSRTKKCVMMSYCVNEYRLWLPEDKKILLGRDVIFDEEKSPCFIEPDTEADWSSDKISDKITDMDNKIQQESDLEDTGDEHFESYDETNQNQRMTSTDIGKTKSTFEEHTLCRSIRGRKI